MRRAIAEKLVQLQETILKDYRFKIWDPWRPRSVQKRIYDKYWQELQSKNPGWNEERLRREVGVFVTAPDKPGRIPPHATGGAIDLTLVDKKSGDEIDMGTVFDHFGPEASPDYFEQEGRNGRVRDNRRILKNAMHGAGFGGDPDEWWHFDYGNQKWAETKGIKTAIYGEVVDVTQLLWKPQLG